jgi:hypothetical protein
MKRTLTQIRCVPRFGYDHTSVRLIEVDTPAANHEALMDALRNWFAMRGMTDAVFALDFDDDGAFAIVNDEAFHHEWGESVL